MLEVLAELQVSSRSLSMAYSQFFPISTALFSISLEVLARLVPASVTARTARSSKNCVLCDRCSQQAAKG
jgi:hypothetical protein